jgi:hypothetical protein
VDRNTLVDHNPLVVELPSDEANMSKPNPKTRVVFGAAAVATWMVLSSVKSSAIPNPTRALISGSVILAWIAFGLFCLCRRYGRPGVVPVVLLVAGVAAWFSYECFADLSKQRQVAELKELGEVRVITTGEIWTGDIYYLYFESDISEPQVLKILRSPGLEKLDRIVFKQTPITDATLQQLAEMPSLEDVYVEQADVTNAGVEKLRVSLPNCRIEIR